MYKYIIAAQSRVEQNQPWKVKMSSSNLYSDAGWEPHAYLGGKGGASRGRGLTTADAGQRISKTNLWKKPTADNTFVLYCIRGVLLLRLKRLFCVFEKGWNLDSIIRLFHLRRYAVAQSLDNMR